MDDGNFPKGFLATEGLGNSMFFFGCGVFAYSWKLPAYSGAFYSQLTLLAFLLTVGAFLLTALAFLLTIGAFLLTVGKCF